jgi:meso-butanediol dehydrogenase/(S,S)-butanediol dehydrogenase/diacetyl reductase
MDIDLNEEFIDGMPDPAAFLADIGKIHPMARTGKLEDVAALVAFLVAEEIGFITGQIWPSQEV